MPLPYPGCKAVELYERLRYLTFTGRHLKKTPNEVIERTAELNALYERVEATRQRRAGLSVSISVSEEERLTRLMAGDMSLYKDDHSTADYALCCLLAKKHDCNAFKVDGDFRESGLYREKWERDDYRENTIARAIKSVAGVVILGSSWAGDPAARSVRRSGSSSTSATTRQDNSGGERNNFG